MSNANNFTVSIIVPVYNVEKYLHKCIDSLLSQTLPDIEIILIDDGSTDNSGNICDDYANNHKNIKVYHQKNSGPSAARNIGLQYAQGEYVGFVDSDDFISPDMYKNLYEIAKSKNIDLVTCNCNIINKENSFWSSLKMPANKVLSKPEINCLISTSHENRILWFTCKGLYKLEIIKKNDITYYNLNSGEDTLFNLEYLFCCNSIYHTSEAYYFYVQTPNSLTRSKYKPNLLEKLEALYALKLTIYSKYQFTSFSNDLNNYTMYHILPMLISNELAHKCRVSEKVKAYKRIRHSEMIKEAFTNSSVKLINSKIKYLALMLKYRMYILLALLSK